MTALVAIISLFFPGAGHALAGSPRRGAAWAVVHLVAIGAVITSVSVLAAVLAIRIVAAVDAVVVAVKARRRGGEAPWKWRPAAVLASLSLGGLLALDWTVAEGLQVPVTTMEPTLAIGDRLVVDKLSVRWRAIERGELVAVRDHGRTGTVQVKRVVALAGDVVAIKRGILSINGEAAAQQVLGRYDYDDRTEGTWQRREAMLLSETIGRHRFQILGVLEEREQDFEDGFFGRTVSFRHDYPTRVGDEMTATCGDLAGAPASQARMTFTEDRTGCVVPPGHFFVLADNRTRNADSRHLGPVPDDNLLGRVVGVWWSAGQDGVRLDRVGDFE